MTRRLEAGPLLVMVGALLLLVSLFLNWYEGEITAWEAFEVWDLVLFVVALGSIAAGVGMMTGEEDALDRWMLPAAVAVVAVVVASQIIDPPPAAAGQDPDTGAWLALAGALVMCGGAVLTYGRVHLSVTVEGREPQQRVAAVDARGPADPTTDNIPVVQPESEEAAASSETETGRGRRLFARSKPAEDTEERATEQMAEDAPAGGNEPAGPKQE